MYNDLIFNDNTIIVRVFKFNVTQMKHCGYDNVDILDLLKHKCEIKHISTFQLINNINTE